MKKVLILFGAVIVVLVAGFFALNAFIYNEKQGDQVQAASHKDATYVIDGKVVKLTNGVSEVVAVEGSASKIVTNYFGNEVRKDLNSDGREDVVFILTQSTGGTGVFYYAVAALNTENGYVGSQALLLGDRIAPQTTESGTGKIVVVNYADRKANEAFTVKPSVAKSLHLLLDPESMQFGEVVQNFEGESDPSRMSLSMKTWNWISAQYSDGKEVKPKQPGKFTLTFAQDGSFTAKTDCNTVGGNYRATKYELEFTSIYATKMYCEGSQEAEFAGALGKVASYFFTSKGELILDFKFDSGSATFR